MDFAAIIIFDPLFLFQKCSLVGNLPNLKLSLYFLQDISERYMFFWCASFKNSSETKIAKNCHCSVKGQNEISGTGKLTWENKTKTTILLWKLRFEAFQSNTEKKNRVTDMKHNIWGWCSTSLLCWGGKKMFKNLGKKQ